MGTTAQKLQYLVDAKAAIDTALTNKGVTPPTELGDYGTAISTLGYKNKLQQVVDRTVTEITAEDLAGVTSIGVGAFSYCAYLTSVTIPNSVTNIRDTSFQGCTSLTSVMIPEGVTRIGYSSFANCSGLTSITILVNTPPVLADSKVFTNTNNCPIYVPAASVDAYKTATNWSSLADRIFAIQE